MAKKRLNQFTGRLDASQIAAGMNAAMTNAQRLTDSATALLEKGDYPLAGSVASLAIEEAGKPSILRELAVARTQEEITKCWKAFRSHTKKNVTWILPQLVADGARRLDDFRPLFDDDAEHPHLLDQVKQLGFYTDCLGSGHWSTPIDVIDKGLASSLVAIARVMSRNKLFSEAEIELWIKHIGPVWRGRKELMEHALVQWFKEMQRAGLAEPGANAMEEFIVEGFSPQTSEPNENEPRA